MFRPVSLFVGFRYTRAKRRNHFISFISLMSILGMALGVMVLITVLSVMNGFDQEIERQVFGMVAPVTVTTPTELLKNWEAVSAKIRPLPDVVATAPFVTGQVLLSHAGLSSPALMNGIQPADEQHITQLSRSMVAGRLDSLQPGRFGVVLGQNLAEHLGAMPGDSIMVTAPRFSLSPAGVMPRFRRFVVTGIFHAGNGFGFDAGLAFVDLQDAQNFFQTGEAVSGIHVRIRQGYAAPVFSKQLSARLGNNAVVNNWTDQFGEFFHAVALEKTMMFFILLLIIAVAAFNLVCTLVMAVNEKQPDIAILRTLGATPGKIMGIFVVQGGVSGLTGTLLGGIGGVLLSRHVTALVAGIEKMLGINFLSSSVYFGLTRLPSSLEWADVVHVTGAALFMSLVATLYPAWRASRVQPAEALRYE